MTSRPPLGVPPRQQLPYSGSGGGIGRPAYPQRALSQQYLPQSPIRHSDSLNDQILSSDAGDVPQTRYATAPRRGGSRLKQELAYDGIDHMGFSESPQHLDLTSSGKVFTPSRIMPLGESSDFGDMSPHTSRCNTADTGNSVPLPMPPRRARFVPPPPRKPSTRQPAAPTAAPVMHLKKDMRPKPYVPEIPADAPRVNRQGGKICTDFTPWTGGHPEDQFTDQLIKQGAGEKPATQVPQELSSAKVPLYSSLKNPNRSLSIFSQFFTSVLTQKRLSGQVNSASTFKPPPRVTLTDTKREVWLKDLANPVISLRKLSRTIPHGIRGRVLLDQCLNKQVPTDRAVWLAKCVGANEIRAFKRKGVNGAFTMGGEAKWIRDWTVGVEQFLESIINAFRENEWKSKVTYAVRLATHLYAEHLLDRDHYMDWLMSGLENSNQAKLPVWLLVIRVYWKDLIKLRRYGRKLTCAITNHYAAIHNHPDSDILQPLISQLCTLLNSLIEASPDSFIHPQTWAQSRESILPNLPQGDDHFRTLFKSIDSRNNYLMRSNVKTRPALRSNLVRELDNLLRIPGEDGIASQLWDIGDDKLSLVRTVFEWCASPYRPGIAKIYVTTAILRAWSQFNIDITGVFLDFLARDALQESSRKHLVYQLVAELVRSGHFSVPRYFQWLIARGGLNHPSQIEPDGPCTSRLLVEIPTHTLSESIIGLRATLLKRSSFSVDKEAGDINAAISQVKYSLCGPQGLEDAALQTKPMSVRKLAKRLSKSSRALQSAVCTWVGQNYMASLSGILQQAGKPAAELLATKFEIVRTILESAQDFTVLEEALKVFVQSPSAELLGACVDTVSLHLPVFAATGAAKVLFQGFLDRLKVVSQEQGIGARPLLASLASLAPRLPGFQQIASQLQNDLHRLDRSSAVDASSPLSDSMATQLQDDETQLNEQIEKLATYTSADKPTIERLFQAVISKLHACCGKADERLRPFCILLSRLRVLDTAHFDVLMKGWALHIRKLTKRPALSQIFPLLVSYGCLSLNILFETTQRSQGQTNAIGCASTYTQEVLQMLMVPMTPSQLMGSEDCYRFQIIQEQARLEQAKNVMPLVRGALAEYSASRNQQTPVSQPLDDEKTRQQLLELLRSLVLVDPDAACQTLSVKSPDQKLLTLIDVLTTKLLVPVPQGGGPRSFEQVLELANEFTLPFCQVKLSLNLAVDDAGGPEMAERLQAQLESLSKAMDNAIDANNVMWTGMLSRLSPEITRHVKNRAESRFLDLIPSFKNAPVTVDGEGALHMAENLLTVVDSIVRGDVTAKASPISSALVEKLADVWEILCSNSSDFALLREVVLTRWLSLLLSYLTLYVSPSAGSGEQNPAKSLASDVRARAVLVLAGIVQELNNRDASKETRLLGERAFDIALVLVDNLPDESRQQCVRVIKDSTSDRRLRYLFSIAVNPAENLMLAFRDKPAPGTKEYKAMALTLHMGMSMLPEKLTPFNLRRWEILSEPTPNVGENDTSLSLTMFDARKI